jgi:hypothetical protein
VYGTGTEGVSEMKSRIRIAAVGLVASMAITAMASTAGAATPTPVTTVNAYGGFISLGLLNTIGLSGGGSAADSTTGGTTDASGTGLCLTLASTTNPCPTDATTPLSSGVLISTTQRASTSGINGTGTPTPSTACLLPLNLGLIDADVACGTASATTDGLGFPTATGEGYLGKVTVSLDLDQLGLGGLLGTGTVGDLCGTSSTSTGTTAVPQSIVSGLLGSVNTLLGGVGDGLLPTSILSSSSSTGPLSGVCSILSGLTGELGGVGGLLSGLTGTSPLLSITLGDSTSNVSSTDAAGSDPMETATATTVLGWHGLMPPGPASGTSSVPPPVSGPARRQSPPGERRGSNCKATGGFRHAGETTRQIYGGSGEGVKMQREPMLRDCSEREGGIPFRAFAVSRKRQNMAPIRSGESPSSGSRSSSPPSSPPATRGLAGPQAPRGSGAPPE